MLSQGQSKCRNFLQQSPLQHHNNPGKKKVSNFNQSIKYRETEIQTQKHNNEWH